MSSYYGVKDLGWRRGIKDVVTTSPQTKKVYLQSERVSKIILYFVTSFKYDPLPENRNIEELVDKFRLEDDKQE